MARKKTGAVWWFKISMSSQTAMALGTRRTNDTTAQPMQEEMRALLAVVCRHFHIQQTSASLAQLENSHPLTATALAAPFVQREVGAMLILECANYALRAPAHLQVQH